ncbi:hypothetical protein I546_4973 [Mycobacterium kansasii 732]|nr:hypothetical protein I546_4973 [Mycobacterium kansasii 732]
MPMLIVAAISVIPALSDRHHLGCIFELWSHGESNPYHPPCKGKSFSWTICS